MLKLKYLFNNVDAAEMILKNWSYDEASLELFKYYRISSNAIYPFQWEGNMQMLRFAPTSEKSISNLKAELEFIAYLRDNQYGALEPVLSNCGNALLEVQTPWGAYTASVFKKVPGVQLGQIHLSDEILFSYGQALGKLHALSSEYEPVTAARWSYREVLKWIEDELRVITASAIADHSAALQETKLLRDYFNSLPMTKSNFGLIHYDFEYDNVFYDEVSKACSVIDFDDAMYHWYAMDIERALDSLQDCIPPETFDHMKKCFLDGYMSEYEISPQFEEILPACRRFANLYAYARTYRATIEQWKHEPDWLMKLRGRLGDRLQEKSIYFGSPLNHQLYE